MFEARRSGYKVAVYANSTTLASAISGGTVKPGDRIMYTMQSQYQYGVVAADGSITLTPY